MSVSCSGNERDRVHDEINQHYNPAAMDGIGQINVLDLVGKGVVSSYHAVDPERSRLAPPVCPVSLSFVDRRTLPLPRGRWSIFFGNSKPSPIFRYVNI